MKEPYVPVPPPEEGSYHDPAPALCGNCGCILQNLHYRGREKVGWCQDHGIVPVYYMTGNWKSPVFPDPRKDDLRSETET